MSRIKIDFATGVIEVEGQEELITKVYEDFKSKIENLAIVKPFQMNKDNNHADRGKKIDIETFPSLAEAIAATKVERKLVESEIVLFAATYLQLKEKKSPLLSSQINTILRPLGKAVANATRELDKNIDCKPQLIIQLRKTASTKQAKREIKVTSAGEEYIEDLLKGIDPLAKK